LKDKLREPIAAPVILECRFFFPVPASKSKKIKAGMLSGEIRHTTKPDLDNLVKFVLDAINGIVILDDRQVCAMYGSKGYGTTPRTEVRISTREAGI
jgi:Holliday junction resolvase RusA-like endonuclease